MKVNDTSIFALPIREISSAGSEHLPYKQGVTGSNPVSPTNPERNFGIFLFKGITLDFWRIMEELLMLVQSIPTNSREGQGSNPVSPTKSRNFFRAFFI